MTNTARWWWVRHAPVPNAAGRLYGQMDLSCDTSNVDAIRSLAAQLPIDATWIVSTLIRTHETHGAIIATGISAGDGSDAPLTEPAFVEQSFGRWQGLSWPEMRAADPEAYSAFWQDPTRIAPPQGESFLELVDRVRPAIERWTENLAGRDIICISHSGTIRAAIAIALGLSLEATMAVVIDNLSLTRLEFVRDDLLRGKGGTWRVRGINVPSRWISQNRPC